MGPSDPNSFAAIATSSLQGFEHCSTGTEGWVSEHEEATHEDADEVAEERDEEER